MSQGHKYFPRLVEVAQSGLILPGRVSVIEVRHDRWCGVFRREACNCDPEIVPQSKLA